MKEKNIYPNQLDDQEIDNLLKQYLLEEDDPINDKVLEHSADVVFNKDYEITPTREKERQLLEKLKRNTTYRWNGWLIRGLMITSVIAVIGTVWWMYSSENIADNNAIHSSSIKNEQAEMLLNKNNIEEGLTINSTEQIEQADSPEQIANNQATNMTSEKNAAKSQGKNNGIVDNNDLFNPANSNPVMNESNTDMSDKLDVNSAADIPATNKHDLSSSEKTKSKSSNNKGDAFLKNNKTKDIHDTKDNSDKKHPSKVSKKGVKKKNLVLPDNLRKSQGQELKQFAGIYWNGKEADMIVIKYKNGKLKIKKSGKKRGEISFVGRTNTAAILNAIIIFNKDKTNKVTGLKMSSAGIGLLEYKKIE